jgi:threonine dehydrogenase-like Zn-dependent dehydrogenase
MSNLTRDDLGAVVREAWIGWAEQQPAPKASWLVPYEQLDEADKEADRVIGEAVLALVAGALDEAGVDDGVCYWCGAEEVPLDEQGNRISWEEFSGVAAEYCLIHHNNCPVALVERLVGQ